MVKGGEDEWMRPPRRWPRTRLWGEMIEQVSVARRPAGYFGRVSSVKNAPPLVALALFARCPFGRGVRLFLALWTRR